MTEPTEIGVMRAMTRAKIGRVGAYAKDNNTYVKGKCKHDVTDFSTSPYTVSWRENTGWKGCAQCILTCVAILEDPDMPTESEELALRTELNPTRRMAPDIMALATFTVGVTLGALLL